MVSDNLLHESPTPEIASTTPQTSFTQWELIPKDKLKEHMQFYNLVRREPTARHWAFDMMVTVLHSYSKLSGGLVPRNITDLDLFWKTGNIPTRNLHLLQSKPYIVTTESTSSSSSARCSLCCQDFLPHDLYYELPCGHRFHTTHDYKKNTDELKNHLRCNNDCPKCGTRVHFHDPIVMT